MNDKELLKILLSLNWEEKYRKKPLKKYLRFCHKTNPEYEAIYLDRNESDARICLHPKYADLSKTLRQIRGVSIGGTKGKLLLKAADMRDYPPVKGGTGDMIPEFFPVTCSNSNSFMELISAIGLTSKTKTVANGIASNSINYSEQNESKNGASIDSESLKLNSPTSTEDEEFLEAVIVEAEAEQASIEDINRLVAIKTRRGQPEFRRALLKAYDGRCCITNCNVEDVLEAAHIISHSEETNYLVMNGLLLRADIHTLFDLHLIKIDERNRIMVSVKLKESDYQKFDGLSIRLPSKLYERPKQDFLLRRLKIMGTCTV